MGGNTLTSIVASLAAIAMVTQFTRPRSQGPAVIREGGRALSSNFTAVMGGNFK